MLRKPQSPPLYRSRAITQPKLLPSQEFCPAEETDVDLPMEKCITYSRDEAQAGLAVRAFTTPHCNWLISHPHDWCQTFPFQQFHALFNSLFKVLFIFPSRYLFAIGLSPIFSFRWNLPPILSCIPKQLDSSKELHMSVGTWPHTGFSPSMTSCSKELRPDHARSILYKLQLGPWGQISNLSCYRFTRRY